MVIKGFNIFNASAGSGKTYQLTKAYLKQLLSAPSKQTFRQLLAITFTNKAVAEMKERILETLYEFSKTEIAEGSRTMFKEIAEELQLDLNILQARAEKTLKRVLHNYSYFEILTIDKFTHKIIRAFAKDLKISQNFEVALDGDLLLDEAIDQLLSRIGNDELITRILVDYALEKIDSEKSWDITYDLRKTGKLLFVETHYPHLQQLAEKEIAHFSELKSGLRQKMLLIQTQVVEKAKQALEKIIQMGFSYEDFPRQTLPNHFLKISQGEIDLRKLYINKIEESLIANTIVKKSVHKPTELLSAELLPLYLDSKEALHQLHFYKNAYNNVLPLTVLKEIAREVQKIQRDKEMLHISEFNKLISNEIKNQPAPYIYERLGERYRYFYIDEFQDTSVMQWQNLIPLIGNALEGQNEKGQQGALLLVGDVKQSIYRWRGGNPEQFLQLSESTANPFSIPPLVHLLDTNWRSHNEVINFNNGFFKHIASKFSKAAYEKLYETTGSQRKNSKTGGCVEISFVEEGSIDKDFYLEKTLETIEALIARGYDYSDISVLVRKNDQGILLANHLASNSIPIISSEGLLLKSSPKVSFLIALLQFIDSPEERIPRYEVLEYLFKGSAKKHDEIVRNLERLHEFLEEQYGFNVKAVSTLNVLDIVEKAIACFDLAPNTNAYITYFVDQLLELDQKTGITLFDFLRFWELKKEVWAISMPENLNAVSLMSVHKSKGLEFKFVIFPFADAKINDQLHSKKLWIPVNPENFHGFDHLLLNASKELEWYSETSRTMYFDEINAAELDDINVLYVALTRAILGVFIFTSSKKTGAYGSLFESYLRHLGIWNPSQSKFTFGCLPPKEAKTAAIPKNITIPFRYTTKTQNLSMAPASADRIQKSEQKEALQRGNRIHEILSNVHSSEDIEGTLQQKLQLSSLAESDQLWCKKKITAIISHPELKKYYEPQVHSKNEVELLDTDGTLLRPDRIVFSETGITIIDYKTGKFATSHRKQLEKYAQVLQKMGYVVLNRILIYIEEDIKPVFI
ncbi:MAG: UvrD-helicase domain-containing protein [Bacteroidota bacterium]